MTTTLGLLAYAAIVAVAAPLLLTRGHWPERAPRLAVVLWLASSASVVMGLVLAGLVLALPISAVTRSVAGLLRARVLAVTTPHAGRGSALLPKLGLVLAITVLARVGCGLLVQTVVAARCRHRHVRALDLVARKVPGLGALLIDNAAPAAYCLPGREQRIVLTTGALAALSPGELDAVLAHERAHLAGRHHLILAGAQAIARAFPVVPLFAAAPLEIARLVELAADDAAGRAEDRLVVAHALVALADADRPRTALAAGGPDTTARVRRLLAAQVPLGTARSAAGVTLTLVVLAAPVFLAVTPLLTGNDYCPLWTSSAVMTPTA